MGDLTKLPVEFKHRSCKPDIWSVPDPPPEMVWEVCRYTRQGDNRGRCKHCPAVIDDPDDHIVSSYGPYVEGCYQMAQEACRVVFAMQKREANKENT